jgi:hypothetical protein
MLTVQASLPPQDSQPFFMMPLSSNVPRLTLRWTDHDQAEQQEAPEAAEELFSTRQQKPSNRQGKNGGKYE